ncbi:PEP-CTERM sorting domain-containing protein [Hydrogenophaga sp.]|uniref:PEP-CTERM sorting domain-containing protein n=1 Tax=Hydrogenophaga sp. TaxID=1904254 RepID=UPI003562AB5B
MMKQVKALLAGLALAVVSMTASAVPTATWSNTYNPSDMYMSSTGTAAQKSTSWIHDITLDGFNALTDMVDSFVLKLRLKDDSGNDPAEYAQVFLAGAPGSEWEVDTGWDWYTNSGALISGMTSLNLDGKLSVTLKANSGDFYFTEASLVAKGREDVRAVPEPGMLMLLGLGLAGMAVVRRRTR